MQKIKIKIQVDTNVETDQAFDFMFGRKSNPFTKFKVKMNTELDPIFILTITEVPDLYSAQEDIQRIFRRFSDFEMLYTIYIDNIVHEMGRNDNGSIHLCMFDEGLTESHL